MVSTLSGLRNRLSLKNRLWISFSVSLLVVTLLTAFLLYRDYRIMVHRASLMVAANAQLSTALRLRDALGVIREVQKSGDGVLESSRFETLLRSGEVGGAGKNVRDAFHLIRNRYDSYRANHLNAPNHRFHPLDHLHHSHLMDVEGAVGSLVQASIQDMHDIEEETRKLSGEAMSFTILALCLVFMASILIASKMISINMEPLFFLMRSMDEIDFQKGIPNTNLVEGSTLPETSRIAESFERLMQKLRGYQALNFRRLLEEKQRSNLIANSISDGIILLEKNRVVYANPVGERILGLQKDWMSDDLTLQELHGKQDSEISEGSQAGVQAVTTAITSAIPVELHLAQGSGKFFYLIQARTVNSADREQILVVAQDVSLVRESQEAKGHFLATLSHEIKTPVTSLTMATRLLNKSSPSVSDQTTKSLIAICAESVDRLRVLLDSLLTVSSFDTLTQKIEKQVVDIGKLVRHSIQTYRPIAAEKGVKLNLHAEPISAPVLMDPAKISWALSNLLTNALRHTPKGGEVTVTLQLTSDSIQVKVRDTGPGIDQKRQSRIFEKFNPFYDIRVARSGGAGAGLAIAREIVVAHQGRIWVSSERGHGAEFCFSLPLKQSNAITVEASAGAVQAGHSPKQADSVARAKGR